MYEKIEGYQEYPPHRLLRMSKRQLVLMHNAMVRQFTHTGMVLPEFARGAAKGKPRLLPEEGHCGLNRDALVERISTLDNVRAARLRPMAKAAMRAA